jgi:predicted nicotinamide N-methyase
MTNGIGVPDEEEEEAETPWTDDRVRWHEDFVNQQERDVDEGKQDEEECGFDIFKDPDPFHVFDFTFQVFKASKADDHGEEEETASGSIQQPNINIHIRGYKTEADQVWKSTGLTLWRAAEHLCQYMVQHSELIQGKRVVELGAGLGLCGILAHRLGGSSVCITDGDSDALVHLRDNVNRNRTTSGADDEGTEVSAHQLIWGKETTDTFLKRQGNQTFDVMIASDIIYARVIVEPLWETVDILLNQDNPQAIFIMAYAKRQVPVSIEFVLEYADKAGFLHELVDTHPEGIWVYVFRRKMNTD